MVEDPIWHGYKVGDLATWAGATMTFLATALALGLAVRDFFRSHSEKKQRARLVAAYLYVPFTEIRTAALQIVKHCPRYASVKSGTASIQVMDDALALATACNAIKERLPLFQLSDAASLPDKHGENLASGVGELNLAVESIQSSLDLYFSADKRDRPDDERFEAAHGQDKSHIIADHVVKKIDQFLAYCVVEFDVIEPSGMPRN